MLRLIFRLVRMVFVAVLAAAVAAKLFLDSHAGEETQEIDLVNIFGSEQLVSSADPFFGGKVTNAFGATVLDLRKARPAPTGIYLDLLIAFGALELVVPHGWRVVFDGTVAAGGFDDATEPTSDPDAPLVRIGGFVALGAVRATTRSPVEVVA